MSNEMDVQTISIEDDYFSPDELAKMRSDSEYCIEQFKSSWRLSSKNIMRAAIAYKILLESGGEIEGISITTRRVLLRIADGEFLPELMQKYILNPSLMKQLLQLPRRDQETLAKGRPVKYVVRSETGYSHRLTEIDTLNRDQLRQVIGRDGIRNEQEQINWIEKQVKDQAKDIAPAVEPWFVKGNYLYVPAANLKIAIKDIMAAKANE